MQATIASKTEALEPFLICLAFTRNLFFFCSQQHTSAIVRMFLLNRLHFCIYFFLFMIKWSCEKKFLYRLTLYTDPERERNDRRILCMFLIAPLFTFLSRFLFGILPKIIFFSYFLCRRRRKMINLKSWVILYEPDQPF